MPPTYTLPGVYPEIIVPQPESPFWVGVPAFLGYCRAGPYTPQLITLWSQVEALCGAPLDDGYLAYAVRGFFENGGQRCYIQRLPDRGDALAELEQGLAELARLDGIDLLCAPDIARSGSLAVICQLQAALLEQCRRLGDRFAILDGLPPVLDALLAPNEPDNLSVLPLIQAGENGALYYPFIWVPSLLDSSKGQLVPPSGHVAGVYARTAQAKGVFAPPANEILENVQDLGGGERTDAETAALYAVGANPLRSFPTRGIRIWGARTLSQEPAWQYVNIRRLFLTLTRWLTRFMTDVVFEPNTVQLWARISRELTAYLDTLFRQGALKGRTAQEAFYVKCDEETNPPDSRREGIVAAEIGLAVAVPGEYLTLRVIQGNSGVSIVADGR